MAAARRRRASDGMGDGYLPPPPGDADLILDGAEASLLDIVDNVLNKGVVLSGDLTIGLAQVDLVYARLSLLLCAADRVLPHQTGDALERRASRRNVGKDARNDVAEPGVRRRRPRAARQGRQRR